MITRLLFRLMIWSLPDGVDQHYLDLNAKILKNKSLFFEHQTVLFRMLNFVKRRGYVPGLYFDVCKRIIRNG